MKEILIMAPEEALPGFALAGVRQQAVSVDDIWEALREACAESAIGVIAVDERLMEDVDRHRLQELTQSWHGVLVTLPAPAGLAEAPADELQALVRRALGYHVRLDT